MARCGHTREDSWWLHDVQGIPLARVCEHCIKEVKSKYNPRVFSGYTQADLDQDTGERIEPLD